MLEREHEHEMKRYCYLLLLLGRCHIAAASFIASCGGHGRFMWMEEDDDVWVDRVFTHILCGQNSQLCIRNNVLNILY